MGGSGCHTGKVLFQKPPTTIKGFFIDLKMACCEKCWGDAYFRSIENPMKAQAEHYQDLINERSKSPCTPEEQAGESATECDECGRIAVHQYAFVCCACGKNHRTITIHDPGLPGVVIFDQANQ